MNFKKLNHTNLVCRGVALLSVLITLYPIVFVGLTSLKATSEFYNNIWGIPREFKWSNYYSAWVTSRDVYKRQPPWYLPKVTEPARL